MRSCENYRTQLFDHLFGLLDGEESLELIEHAGRCEECRAALLEADGQRKLIAAAAKAEFPMVRFEAPAAVALLPGEAKKPRRALRLPRHAGRWAAAACLLLTLAGLSAPVLRYASAYRDQKQEVARHEQRLDELAKEERRLINQRETVVAKALGDRKAAEEKFIELAAGQQKELDQAADAVLARQMFLVVTGHEALRPGVPNDYRIEVKNMKDEQERATLDITLRDLASNKVILNQTNIASDGAYTLSVPPDLPLRASDQVGLEVVARTPNGPQGALREQLTLAKSSYVTQLVTDKPMYQPGEVVHFRSLTLDRFSLRPATEDFRLIYTVLNPQGIKVFQRAYLPRLIQDGKEVLGPDRKPIRGIGAGEFQIPSNLADGGEYILTVEEAGKKFPMERRKFLINKYQKHELNKEIKFDQASYGPGAAVVAHGKVARAEGGQILASLPVTAVVRVDGAFYKANGQMAANREDARIPLRTDSTGGVRVPFQLPAKIDKGDASLTVEFTDGTVTEPLVRPIPVVVNKLQIEFFPEGGDLVAGVPNRVYFQARTPLDKPADVSGAIVDGKGQVVAQVRTLNDKQEPGINQGLGVFQLTPALGTSYRLKIESPAGIEGKFVLPAAKAEGVALKVTGGVTSDQEAIPVVLHSAGKDRDLYVGAYCRGALLDFRQVQVREGQPAEVNLKPSGGAGGVYRITVFEKQGANGERLVPLAERLVYRSPAARLNLAVRADKKLYAPGERVNLHLSANTENGQPAPTVLLVGVVDKSVLKMADERTARSLPTHFLLTSEVRRPEDLEFTDVLLSDHAQARQALDLLLGTQGWRRFIESDPERFQRENGDPKKREDARCKADVDRLRVVTGKLSLDKEAEKKVFTSFEVRQEQVLKDYKPRFDQVEAQLNNAQVAINQLHDTRQFEEQKHDLYRRAGAARADYQVAFAKLEAYDAQGKALQQRALLGFGVVLLLVAGVSVLVGLLRIMPRPVPLYAGAAAAVGACALLVMGTFVFESRAPEQSPVAALRWKDSRTPAANDEVLMNEELDRNAGEGRGGFGAAPVAAEGGPAQNGRGPGLLRPAEKAKKEAQAQGKPGNDQPLPEDRRGGLGGGARKPAAVPMAPMAATKGQMGKRGQNQADKQNQMRAAKGAAMPGHMAGLRQAPMAGQPWNINGMLNAAGKDANRFDEQAARQQQNRNLQLDALQETPAQRNLQENLKKLQKNDRGERKALLQDGVQRYRRAAQQVSALAPCIVREYAYHRGTDTRAGEIRSDFAETLYWHPALVLANGQADIGFDLCDSVTTFQVIVAGHTTDGRLGAATAEVVCRKPFSLSAVVPLEVTANDTIDLPVAVANNSDEARRVHVSIALEKLALMAGTPTASRQELMLAPHKRDRMVFRLRPTVREGTGTITLKGASEPFGADMVQYSFRIVPEGFPAAETRSDLLEGIAHQEITLPRDRVKDTLKCELQVYPSSLADLQQGLDGLLREPHGCFEQTSTSNYPNVMILNYLKESGLVHRQPQTAERARGLLSRGYQKLIAFECRKPTGGGPWVKQGYEWFGGNAPPHEALTAYGLLQFRDMAKVGQPVDQEMVERTRRYLASRKDGKGGFLRNPRALDRFGRAPEPITNAYIVWALTESDKDAPIKEDLGKELDALVKQAKDANGGYNKDPYFLALVANSLLNRGMTEAAGELLKQLAATQKPDGHLDGARTSITGSGGRDLQIEATALGVLAWLKANRPDYQVNVRSAAGWIAKQRGGRGAFGSTQATILALKALIGQAKANRRPMHPGRLTLTVNGQVVAAQDFPADLKEALTLNVPNPEKHLKAGVNQVKIEVTGDNVLPYTLNCSYQALTPNNPAAPPVKLAAGLDRADVRDGETVRLNVWVENASGRGQGMAVAVIGLPAGLNLPENMEQLRNLAKSRNDGTEPGDISAFEVRGRELVLYWRDLAPAQKIELNLDLVCRVPGNFRGPASRAYLYYNADHKHWIAPLTVAVAPKAK